MAQPEELMQIGQKLVDLCNAGRDTDCLDQLYSANAVSVEAVPIAGTQSPEAAGLEAIRGKHEWWYANHEVHSSKADGPYIHGDQKFAVIFDMDVTEKASGERRQMREVAQYFVEKGLIVREEFSYPVTA